MTKRLIDHLRSNLVGYVALFIALGGTSYAATALPRNSVGTRQLRNGAVTRSKLASGLGGQVWATSEISVGGTLISSDPKDVQILQWQNNNFNYPYQSGIVRYPHDYPRNCLPIATGVNGIFTASGVLPTVTAGAEGRDEVQLATDGFTAIDLAIVCPH